MSPRLVMDKIDTSSFGRCCKKTHQESILSASIHPSLNKGSLCVPSLDTVSSRPCTNLVDTRLRLAADGRGNQPLLMTIVLTRSKWLRNHIEPVFQNLTFLLIHPTPYTCLQHASPSPHHTTLSDTTCSPSIQRAEPSAQRVLLPSNGYAQWASRKSVGQVLPGQRWCLHPLAPCLPPADILPCNSSANLAGTQVEVALLGPRQVCLWNAHRLL